MVQMNESVKSIWTKTYRAVGFSKGYNFSLFVIFAGALMGFTLARFSFLNIQGQLCGESAAPGECYYTLGPSRYRVGMILHLAGCLPGAFLACFQFVPIIRHKLIMFHRVNGYLVILLMIISNAGALMVTRRAFGGSLGIQSSGGMMVLLSTFGLGYAYYNIKKLQIDRHRAWMLRSFVYMGSIVTNRLILICSATVVTAVGGYYHVWPCGKLDYVLGGTRTLSKYPTCAAFYDGSNPDANAVVKADMNSSPENAGAALGVSFGLSSWLSFALHAICVEIYLRLTPKESARLRQVSYERQVEAGYKNPRDPALATGMTAGKTTS